MKILSQSKLFIGMGMLCTTLSLLLSCSGYKSGKIPETENIKKTADSTQKPVIGNAASVMPYPPSQTDTTFKPISLSNLNDTAVRLPADEYNVERQILSFYDKKTRKLIKDVDLVQQNPFHNRGLERRKEPYPNSTYFLIPKGIQNKHKLKKFLPQGTFDQIPEDFKLIRAIAAIYTTFTDNKYVTVTYELDWLPDAYSDEGEYDGPGYSIHHVVVYDSLGNKIYTRLFDGTSIFPSVSEDGKCLFTMACISPEWENNTRYRFTVVNIQSNKVAYEEQIENCKKNGGGGNFYIEEVNKILKCNIYKIQKLNNTSKRYLYYNNMFYVQKHMCPK